ncbi:MAG: FAD-dependent monooxygenase, partial [Planctomycetota bacterium]
MPEASDAIDGLHRPARSLPDRVWDAVVVGAGPAGATAASCLALRGLQVLLVERERLPREKVCGDGLISDSIRSLRNMDVLDAVRRKGHVCDIATVVSPGGITMDIPGTYLTLRRSLLDVLLVEKAIQNGATICEGKACAVSTWARDRPAFWIEGRSGPIRAQLGIIATGANVALARTLRLVADPRPNAVAVRCYVRSPFRFERFLGVYDKAILPGYFWIFPMGNDEYNVGCIHFRQRDTRATVNVRRALARFLRDHPTARQLMSHGEIAARVRGGVLRCGLRGTRAY